MIFTLSDHENGVPFMDYFSYCSPRQSSARSVITRRAREILWNERCAAASLGRSSKLCENYFVVSCTYVSDLSKYIKVEYYHLYPFEKPSKRWKLISVDVPK